MESLSKRLFSAIYVIPCPKKQVTRCNLPPFRVRVVSGIWCSESLTQLWVVRGPHSIDTMALADSGLIHVDQEMHIDRRFITAA